MKYPYAILSDAGDIIIDTKSCLNMQKKCINDIYSKRKKGLKIKSEAKDTYSLFKPYKILSQTKNSLEDAINQFFKEQNINSSYEEYEKAYEECSLKIKPRLFPGIIKTLERLNEKGIPFILISDSYKKGLQLLEETEKLIVEELKKNGIYNRRKFDISKYIGAIVSSKDFGFKKPAPEVIQKALNLYKIKENQEKLFFIAHESDEIFGIAKIGIDVFALNYENENDSLEISEMIKSHNQKYIEGKEKSKIYCIKKFSEILKLKNIGYSTFKEENQ